MAVSVCSQMSGKHDFSHLGNWKAQVSVEQEVAWHAGPGDQGLLETLP